MTYKKSNILIVDDDQATCDFVGEILAGNGYTYEIALNARDAFIKMRNHSFDIVLLDIRLPDKSGIDLIKLSQSSLETPSTIMMTAVKDLNTAIHTMKMGASDYITKPFTIDKLTTSIATTIKNRESINSASTKSENTLKADNSRNIPNKSRKIMNAISIGVDAQLDYNDFHSKIVTEKTVCLARQLGLPNEEIDNWQNTRNEQYSKRQRYLLSILLKLQRNPLAQLILSAARLIHKNTQTKGEWN